MVPSNDEHNEMTGKPPDERFDDDRLLAYALDLEDDAELEQALATEAALRERLQSIRADLSVVEDQGRAAVPAPEEAWADLSAVRWDGLRPFVATHPAAERRRRFGWRVLAPTVGVAAAAALAIGIALSQTGGLGGRHSGSAEFGASAASGSIAAAKAPTANSGLKSFATDAAAYQTAVVARAGTAAAGVQQFAVVRTLKGHAGHDLRLQIEVGGALKEGSLALLLLKPVDQLAVPLATPAPASAQAVPSPSASPTDSRHAPVVLLYLYQGVPAAVHPLPAGTDPNSVTLP